MGSRLVQRGEELGALTLTDGPANDMTIIFHRRFCNSSMYVSVMVLLSHY